MQLEIRDSSLQLGSAFREQLSDHIEGACRRFAGRIRRIVVSLVDTNGPRGGLDKLCQMAVQLTRGEVIRSCSKNTNLTAAVYLATDRVTRALSRRLERNRKRSVRRRRWQFSDEGD